MSKDLVLGSSSSLSPSGMHPAVGICTFWGTSFATWWPSHVFQSLGQRKNCLHWHCPSLTDAGNVRKTILWRGDLMCVTNYFFKWLVLLISSTLMVQMGEVRPRSLCTQLWSKEQVWRGKELFPILGSLFYLLRAGINAMFLRFFFPKFLDFHLLFLGDEVLTTSKKMLCIGHVFYSGYFHFYVLSLNQKDVLFSSKEMGGLNKRGTERMET